MFRKRLNSEFSTNTTGDADRGISDNSTIEGKLPDTSKEKVVPIERNLSEQSKDKPIKKGIKKMAGVTFTDEQLERALENYNTADEIKKSLADEHGNEPSPLSLKNRIFSLMQKNQTFYRVEGLDRSTKKRKKHIEFNQRGIFIPAALLDGCDFEQGNKKDSKKGQKFKVAFTEYDITLSPVRE